ncbi:MAG: calcium-binding protein [Burkholderiaceae bacterium]
MPIPGRATTFTYGTLGNDIIYAQYLDGDLIDGLAGDDIIFGMDSTDIYNSTGSDWLYGGDGRDTIYGLGGHDAIFGGSGNDKIYGGAGNDAMHPDGAIIGNDFMDGGDGFDTVIYYDSGATRGVRVDLRITSAQDTGGAGRDTIRNVEIVYGTYFNDTITGNAADNQLYGVAGADTLNGGDGNDGLYAGFGLDLAGDTLNGGNGNDFLSGSGNADKLNGGSGDDVLIGYAGADTLTGGSGLDRFDFINTADYNPALVDRITDFNGAEDLIVLWGSNPNVFIGSDAFSASGVSELRVTSNAGAQLVEYDTNGNGVADMKINVVGTTLVADDFLFSYWV